MDDGDGKDRMARDGGSHDCERVEYVIHGKEQ